MLEEYLRICGIPFLIYAIARLLDYWRKSIDSEKKYWRWIFLNIICFTLWIASFPVSLIMRGLNYLHENLIEYNNRMDDIKRSRELCASCKRTIIDPLRQENERLKAEKKKR